MMLPGVIEQATGTYLTYNMAQYRTDYTAIKYWFARMRLYNKKLIFFVVL